MALGEPTATMNRDLTSGVIGALGTCMHAHSLEFKNQKSNKV